MIRLEEFNLYFSDTYEPIIDDDNLERDIINHLRQLNNFTFHIRSIISLDFDAKMNLPSNKDIKRTFENFQNNQIISSAIIFQKEIYFLPHIPISIYMDFLSPYYE
jgi:hypothetical protein